MKDRWQVRAAKQGDLPVSRSLPFSVVHRRKIMGFFKKLFEKKDCEICGGEIGLLGNRKLVDGDMCKKCAAKLSPWF